MINNLKRLILSSVVIATFVTLTACRTSPIRDYKSQPVPSNITSAAQVAKAIQIAGTSLGWVISKEEDGKMMGVLNLRSHQAVVSIPYSATGYSILYSSSIDLKYNAEDRTIHSNYNGWVLNLNRAIQANLVSVK
ncbi:hypothetical protein [Hydrogenovibrio kuenenii]|uniref:hypothetical protein n=1 Tax=Hydrogenovibrio kuenenii TaxID=63658 RepID=UPI0004641322|nr:hypothetical protein [Hydrogenovibrio kuenenii]